MEHFDHTQHPSIAQLAISSVGSLRFCEDMLVFSGWLFPQPSETHARYAFLEMVLHMVDAGHREEFVFAFVQDMLNSRYRLELQMNKTDGAFITAFLDTKLQLEVEALRKARREQAI